MARRQGSGAGCGCLTFFLVFIIGLAFCVWHFGLVDRLLYLVSVQQGTSHLSEQSAARIDAEERGLYVYEQLGESDRELYRIMLDAFQTRESRTYPEMSMDEVARMRDLVLADHPELFYINGVSQLTTTNRDSGLVVGMTIEGQYAYTEEEAEQLQGVIDGVVADCLAGAPDGDDYAKARYFYEYLANTTEYDRDAAAAGQGEVGADEAQVSAGQTIADVFASRKAVCGGYARAYQYLLQQVGIQCVYITGSANGGRHAWCLAYLDGAYYYVDPTWGDPQFLGAEGEEVPESNFVNYDYLCVTTADIAHTHVLATDFMVPECSSTADNYYVREDLLFDAPDGERLGRLAAQAAEQGGNVQVRCTDAAVYTELLDSVVSSGSLANYLPSDSYRYTHSDDFLTIAIFPS